MFKLSSLMTSVLLSILLIVLPNSIHGKEKRVISEKDARRAIAQMPGLELKTSAVRVLEISGAGDTATVVADVTTAFRFTKKDGRWRATEFRTGDRRWDEIDWLAAGIGDEMFARVGLELDALANEFAALKREDKQQKEFRRGSLLAKSFSSVLSSAVIIVDINASFRLQKAGKTWQVTEIKIGEEDQWIDVASVVTAVNNARTERARTELNSIKLALDDYRRERGSYVVTDDYVVLIDHLSPQYLPPVIRIDPWDRPYRYEGTPERYMLRSDGADGKEGTADDITVSSQDAASEISLMMTTPPVSF